MTNSTTGNPGGDGPKKSTPQLSCPKLRPTSEPNTGRTDPLENLLADVSSHAAKVVVKHSPTDTTTIPQKEHLNSDPSEAENATSTESGNARSQAVVGAKLLDFPRIVDPAPSEGAGGQVGEEGGSAPGITNREFLNAVFRDLSSGEYSLALALAGDPTGKRSWFGFDAQEVEARCPSDTNNYFNCASFRQMDEGELRALEAQAARYHCLVLDDIGTKTGLDALPKIEPTWILETSPGNFHVGYRLSTPISDPAIVKAAQKKIFGSGIGDKGAGGMARWVRLPNGVNGKPKNRDDNGQPFQCRLAEWNPGAAYELADLVALLARASVPVAGPSRTPITEQPLPEVSHPDISSEVFRPAKLENSVVTALKEAGLYKFETAPGRHEITCPWVEEHTDQIDGGACFFEPSPGYPLGGFKCHHSHGDKYRLKALLDRFELTRRDVHNKPCIRIVEGELQGMVDAAQVVLAATGEFFNAGGVIVKVAVNQITGAASLKPQLDADLTLALSSAADWEQYVAGNWRRCNPNPNCIRLLAHTQTHAYLPVLRGIARQPLFDKSAGLISAAGYDPVSQLYCAFDPQKFARPEPSEDNARAALERLMQLLREFHFASDRDRSTALAAIFTAVLRPCLGRAPAFHVRAPSPGSGKSLLCDVIARFAGPGEPAKVSYPRTEEEATKVILAALLEAHAVLNFDDMTVDWRAFGAINRLLTSQSMTDRILGVSKMATVSTDTLVLGSGNNTGPTGDLNRRVLVIDLDARNECPATLSYEGDPLGQMEANREAFVADVLLIVESWIAAGMPKANLTPIATYGGRWTDFCRQPLVWLGLDDPAEGLIEQLKTDPESATLGRLLRAWYDLLGSKPQTLRALIEGAEGNLLEAIEDLPFSQGGPLNRTSFGRYLGRNAGRPVQGLKLEKADSRERNAWRVIAVDGASSPDVAPSAPPSPPSPPAGGPARPSFD